MHRRSALIALVVVLMLSIGSGAIRADNTRPTPTTIGTDESLTLYSFPFVQFNEIPWNQAPDSNPEPDPYDATMTVYVLDGTFAFYGENQNQDVVINPPPGPPGSICLEIRDAVSVDGELFYEPTTPGSEMCVQAGEENCTEMCVIEPLPDQQAVILEAGSVLYLPTGTACFICAIEEATDGPAHLAVTVRTEDAENSWARVATPALEATPGAGSDSTPTALRLGKLPMKNPGGCAGRV